MLFRKSNLIPLLISIAILTASCGSPAQTQSDIATAVAQTIQAQDSLTKVSTLPTLTSVPTLPASATPEVIPTNTSGPLSSNPGCVASARLIGESPPDDTLFLPGEYFWKTWTFQNTGTCIWNTSYSLVFKEGDLLGGLISYPFTEVVQPEGTYSISIYLQAPATEGTSKGYWRFKTPWGEDFGVGPQNISFYVQIGVSVKPKYGITSVTYELVRDPAQGCPLNVRYTVVATVTSSGPLDFAYYWDQKDGNESGIRYYSFKEAGSAIFKRDWLISLNDSPNPRWIKFIVTEPVYQDYGEAIIDHDCFKNQ